MMEDVTGGEDAEMRMLSRTEHSETCYREMKKSLNNITTGENASILLISINADVITSLAARDLGKEIDFLHFRTASYFFLMAPKMS